MLPPAPLEREELVVGLSEYAAGQRSERQRARVERQRLPLACGQPIGVTVAAAGEIGVGGEARGQLALFRRLDRIDRKVVRIERSRGLGCDGRGPRVGGSSVQLGQR